MNNTFQENYDVALQAPAKINLILRVLGKRDDGYHELETWMHKIGLYDTLLLKISGEPGIDLSCSDSSLPVDRSNLVWQAAQLFFETSLAARGKGVRIHLEKNIPVAAGLGGGSSDAGTLLQGLNNFFGHEFDDAKMIDMAKSLGADVPFFVIDAESVLATGIGEKMVQVQPPSDCKYLIVNPGFSVSTATIFKKFALTRVDKNSTLTGSRKLCPESLRLADIENDLESVTMALFPVIADIKEELGRSGAEKVLMSGSGPSVFGIFTESSEYGTDAVAQAADRMRLKFGDKVYICSKRVGV